MKIYVDLPSRTIVEGLTFPRPMDKLVLKRRDNMKLDVVFVTDGAAVDLGSGGETGKLGIKADRGYASGYLASATGWTKTGTGTSAVYSFALSLNTTEINTAFAAEPASVPAMIEIEWVVGAYRTSSNTLSVDLQNDVNRGDEGVPTSGTPAYPPPGNLIVWRPDITGRTGGTGNLDGEVSATMSLGELYALKLAGQIQFWQLLAGTDAADGTTIIHPTDYDAGTNARVWKLVTDGGSSVGWGDISGKPSEFNPSEPAPYAAGNITGATTFDRANGKLQKAALTGNVTLNAPSNGAEGKTLKLWLTASGADRTLNLDAAIHIPSDSALSMPKTLTSGKRYVVLLDYDGTAWSLLSLVGGV